MGSNCSKEYDNNLLFILIRTKRNEFKWNEKRMRCVMTSEESVKGLENGVPIRPAYPSTLSERLGGCPPNRESEGASAWLLEWAWAVEENRPSPLVPGSQELSVLRASAEYTSDSYRSVPYPSLHRGRNKFWAGAHLEAWHWVHSLVRLWFSEVPESSYWDCPKEYHCEKLTGVSSVVLG